MACTHANTFTRKHIYKGKQQRAWYCYMLDSWMTQAATVAYSQNKCAGYIQRIPHRRVFILISLKADSFAYGSRKR